MSGNGLEASGSSFVLLGADAERNNTEPLIDEFAFSFVLIDDDGVIGDYTDGHIVWDSKGALMGGEQIVFKVVPEPSSAALLGLGVLGLVARRKRQA